MWDLRASLKSWALVRLWTVIFAAVDLNPLVVVADCDVDGDALNAVLFALL